MLAARPLRLIARAASPATTLGKVHKNNSSTLVEKIIYDMKDGRTAQPRESRLGDYCVSPGKKKRCFGKSSSADLLGSLKNRSLRHLGGATFVVRHMKKIGQSMPGLQQEGERSGG